MTFTGHLGELRTRLVRSVVAVIVGFVLCYTVSNQLIEVIAMPLRPLQQLNSDTPDSANTVDMGIKWTVLNPLEPVLVKLKLAAYAGLLFTFPYILYNACAFVFPGLTFKERRAAKILIFGSTGLAVVGAAVAYWGVFPLVLPYLVEFAPDFVDIQLRLNETLSLILKGLLGFALAFQFPMVVLILVYLDLLTPETLKNYRRVAIVLMFVLGAMLTPPDPFSMIMMALPLVLLYEVSIVLSYVVIRRRAAASSDSG